MMRAVIGLSVCLLATSGYADEHWLQARLQQLSRQRDGGDNKPVVIDIPDGVYRLEKTLKLSPDVIGDGLTLRAENSGKAILSGGRLLPQGERDERGLWRVPLPTDSNRFGRPRFLMIDGRLRPAARHPNTGYHRIEETLPDRRSGFVAATGDVPNGIDDGFDLILLHDWSSSRLPVQSYDDRTRTLRTVGPIGCEADHYAIDHFEKQPRYWLEGHSAFADVEGEWYIDADSHELVIVGGENQKESPTVVLPWLSELLVASGTDKNPIGDLTIQGVVFTESRFEMPPGGYAGAQASMHEARDERGARMSSGRAFVQAAVKIEEASGCRVTNCDFRSLGGSGLWIGGRTRDCIISRSRFAEIGGNGLNLGEDNSRRVDGRTWYMAAPDQVPTGNKVERCEFSHCGQILPGAVAVWGALHRKLEITGNHIHDCPYTGISLGWLWNDRKSPAAGNIIRDNRIEFVMQVLSDGGGIYTLGRQPDTLITGNRISDIPLNAGRAESNGLFLDQGTTGLTISGNTIRRVEKSPVRFHQCGKNIVRENRWELATDETPPVRFNRTPKENIAVAANEVLEPQRSYFLIGNSLTWDTVPSRLDGNVHWHVDCGKNLVYIRDNHQSPCVGTSRLWPTALTTCQYDYVSIQPHYGTTIEQDVKVISHWMTLQPEATFVIHTGWARHADSAKEASDTDPSGVLTHSAAYYDELLRQLKKAHPGREILRTRAMDYLHRIAKEIEAGTAPLRSIEDLYRDAIHMTIPGGRYLMHNAMRQALGQPISNGGFEKIDPGLKQYLNEVLSR